MWYSSIFGLSWTRLRHGSAYFVWSEHFQLSIQLDPSLRSGKRVDPIFIAKFAALLIALLSRGYGPRLRTHNFGLIGILFSSWRRDCLCNLQYIKQINISLKLLWALVQMVASHSLSFCSFRTEANYSNNVLSANVTPLLSVFLACIHPTLYQDFFSFVWKELHLTIRWWLYGIITCIRCLSSAVSQSSKDFVAFFRG